MGGSSKQPEVKQTAQTTISPEQQAIFNLAFPYAQEAASKPIQQFEGSGIAPLTTDQITAQMRAKQAGETGGALATQAAGTQSKLLDPAFMLDPANNEYLQAANQATTGMVTRNLNENILPQVRMGAEQAGGAYSGGSSRQGIAEGLAIGRTNQDLSDALAKANYGSYQAGLQQMQGAVNANAGVQDQQLFNPLTLGAVGAQNQAADQAALDEKIRKFYTSQELPMLQAQQLFGLISGMPGGGTTSTTTGALPTTTPMNAGLGGAMAGGSLGSIVPGIGTGLGAGIGGLLGLLTNRR